MRWVSQTEPSLRPPTGYLGARFPSAAGQTRFSMDAFVFWTSGWQIAWFNATRWCLHGFGPADAPTSIKKSPSDQRADHPIPEMLLNEVRLRFNLTFRMFPGGSGHAASRARLKLTAVGPQRNSNGRCHSFWHSHNPSAINKWIHQYKLAFASPGTTSPSRQKGTLKWSSGLCM